MLSRALAVLLSAFFVTTTSAQVPAPNETVPGEDPASRSVRRGDSAALRIVETITDEVERRLLTEVLERNPAAAAAAARARAAALKAPQAKALPDPVAGLTAYLATPETRVGPQRLMAGYTQALPWAGTRSLREQAAVQHAESVRATVEALELGLLTEARRLYLELAFLQQHRAITEAFRGHLLTHEEIAQARYASGVGSALGVVKLQAEITRIENDLIAIERRRADLGAALNRLRDRPALTDVPELRLPALAAPAFEAPALLALALARRPELAADRARRERARTLEQLADKGYRPDFTVGLTYTLVERRQDALGRLTPPTGNGNDILGVQAGVRLPLWRKKLDAARDEATELHRAAEEDERFTEASIDQVIGGLVQRLPLTWQQLRLINDILIVQAEEALESARSGYIAGTLNALDLLDAEHVLFQAQTSALRSETDYAIQLAELEGAVGASLNGNTE